MRQHVYGWLFVIGIMLLVAVLSEVLRATPLT